MNDDFSDKTDRKMLWKVTEKDVLYYFCGGYERVSRDSVFSDYKVVTVIYINTVHKHKYKQ